MVVGVAAEANPQTASRITVTGLARLEPDQELKARWLALHPYAALYGDFTDFHLWSIRPRAALFVGGFARATRLREADLMPDSAAVARLALAEADIRRHCNDDHADALAAMAVAAGGPNGAWRMVAVDVDGCDLALSDLVIRVAWREPVGDAPAVRSELVRLAKAAREQRSPS
jgi:putative heme iron utilization protein